ncbi:head GIN domain-containing protein [Robiginitalea sediminis]|uniref:head GIN domain-containing protein n=1 Tax=Robiginitalea sediminis TaxID=1982593 RepID=UPI000B4BE633|nr:head GIN domain-containing protein [Robiginitalea sediminis]
MRLKYIHIVLLCILALAGCGENAPDCLQSSGKTVEVELDVPSFERITVFERIRLVLRQGPQQEVRVQTGENLLPEISATVVDGTLELRNENTCNLFRSYGNTTIWVTVPDLSEVRSSTGLPIVSEGPLGFTDLRLISESFQNEETETTDGTFDLELSGGRVRVVSNGIAYFRLRGTASLLEVRVAAGDSRVEAGGLQAGIVRIDHRGSNAMEVYPTDRIEGVIRGYGDVRAFNRPDEISVEELFRGRLLFVGE